MRTTEGGGVLGFAIAFLAFAFGGALGLPESVRLLVIGVGVLLALLSAGMRGLGLAALVLAGVVFAMPLVTRGLAGSASPDLEEPIPVPSGYGLVLEPSTNVMHLYASKTLVGDTKGISKAQQAVLDYYVERLQELGWTVVSLGDDAEFKAPDSDIGIHVMTYQGLPNWSNGGAGTLIVQIDARSCPDDKDYCLPARIYEIKPYTGAASDLDEAPPPVSATGTTPPPQEDGGYTLSQHDKENVDYTWDRGTEAQRRAWCVHFRDGLSDAELDEWRSASEEYGVPFTEDLEANVRARAEYMVATYC
jgi:hypothetical protein